MSGKQNFKLGTIKIILNVFLKFQISKLGTVTCQCCYLLDIFIMIDFDFLF